MSMYALLRNYPKPTQEQVESAFEGENKDSVGQNVLRSSTAIDDGVQTYEAKRRGSGCPLRRAAVDLVGRRHENGGFADQKDYDDRLMEIRLPDSNYQSGKKFAIPS